MKLHAFTHTQIPGGVTAPQGFTANGVAAGIKNNQGKDLAVIFSQRPAVAAGVFTTNRIKAAPLLITQQHLTDGTAQAIIVNSGNANACTGEQGMADARTMAEHTAKALGIPANQVIVASTGVIGVPMPMEVLTKGIQVVATELSKDGGKLAAQAIMTTDTQLKEISLELELNGVLVKIGAMAKGSGMIHPNMATMLGFVTTDAQVSRDFLQVALKQAVEKSFNMISVDGDTSTNDMVVALANGQAGNAQLELGTADGDRFQAALEELCIYLAKSIARDGEGATKLVEIKVLNAPTQKDAKTVAMSINTSSLVKTAIYGEDANWGRIIAAVGYSGADFDADKIDIYIGSEQVAANSQGLPFSESAAKAILQQEMIPIVVDLHSGTSEAVAWGCDFSYDYVKINASYRS